MVHPTLPILLFVVLLSGPTSACRCFPPTLHGTYDNPSTVNYVRALVRRVKEPSSPFGKRKIVLRILQNFKGCPPPRKQFVFSFVSSATCGIKLIRRKIYVLPIRAGKKPMIGSCDFIRLAEELTREQIAFLNTRNVCCGDKCKCAGDNRVNCFRQPCSPPEVAPPGCVKPTCRDNYCGGCLAEWFDGNGRRCKSGGISS